MKLATSTRPSAALYVAAIAVNFAMAAPLAAQDRSDRALQVAQLRAQVEAQAARIDQLEGELGTTETEPAAQDEPAASANTVAEPKDPVSWRGAPLIEGKGGWSFKPRGRIQVDAGSISVPNGIADSGLGAEVRRAYLGVEGTMPEGFGYRAEINLADSEVEVTDLYLNYSPSKATKITIGQTKPFWGLEEMTSDLFTSFTERAAFNGAFGFERRLGASAIWMRGALLVQGGVFTDNIADLSDGGNNALSYDGRVVFMPRLGGGQLHLAGSAHRREWNDTNGSVRYRARPFIHTPDISLTDTGPIAAASETSYGLEVAYIAGRVHATGEAHWQKVGRVDLADPTFFGGYAEVGFFLTRGDTRGYKSGNFDRVKPAKQVGEGGIGAVQVNLRYDYLDLVDAGINGGAQDIYGVSIVWIPAAHTKFIANYGHLDYIDAAVPAAGGSRDYSVDALGVRAQIDY